jgi:hypothetical protein
MNQTYAIAHSLSSLSNLPLFMSALFTVRHIAYSSRTLSQPHLCYTITFKIAPLLNPMVSSQAERYALEHGAFGEPNRPNYRTCRYDLKVHELAGNSN